MKNSNFLKIGLVGITVFIVLISGCISSSTTETKTFSDGVMTFNYPENFVNATYTGNDSNSSSPMRVINKFKGNNQLVIMVGRNRTETSPTEVRDWSISNGKNRSDGELLCVTTETNPNGIVVEKINYTQNSNLFPMLKLLYINMFFKTNGSVYAISVHGPDLFKQQITDITNMIFQSIR